MDWKKQGSWRAYLRYKHFRTIVALVKRALAVIGKADGERLRFPKNAFWLGDDFAAQRPQRVTVPYASEFHDSVPACAALRHYARCTKRPEFHCNGYSFRNHALIHLQGFSQCDRCLECLPRIQLSFDLARQITLQHEPEIGRAGWKIV